MAGPDGSEPCPAPLSPPHGARDRRAALRGAASPSGLGLRQAARLARAAASGDRRGGLARGEHGGRPPRPGGLGEEAAPAAAASASRRRAPNPPPPQRSLDGGFQKPVPHPRPGVVLPA